jgi:hypothetical protein
MGVEDSVNLEIPADGAHIPSSRTAPEGMDAQELLIALDDLQSVDTQPDSPEPLDLSTDEIVFDTDDSKEDRLTPFDSEEDEILFDLEPSSGEDEIESIGLDPLDKKSFSDFDGPDEKRVAVDSAEIQEETADKIDETDLFLAEEPTESAPALDEKAFAGTQNKSEEPDSQELFLSLDDLPGDGPKPGPSVSTRIEEDDIAFELEEVLNQEETPIEKETPDEKGFWDSDEIEKQVAAFELEETVTKTTDASPEKTTDEKMDVNLFKDLDIEPLDLELSLDDIDKNP